MAPRVTMRTDDTTARPPDPGAPTTGTGPTGAGPTGAGRPLWLPWLAAAWVGFLVLAAIAEIFDLEALRLALDFQRHLR